MCRLAGDDIARVPSQGARAAYAEQCLRDKLLDHKHYIQVHGEDMPELRQ
jgi:xylulose-5-phosphate/fructose-6-phosphate phosphoketolase